MYGSVLVRDQHDERESLLRRSAKPIDSREVSSGAVLTGTIIEAESFAAASSADDILESLRPYFSRCKKNNTALEILEILPTGESGYMMTKTLKELQQFIHEEVMKIESSAPLDKPFLSRGVSDETSNQNNQTLLSIMKSQRVIELQLADIQMFESQKLYQSEEPILLARRHAVGFAPLRAIVLANKLVLIVPKGADSLLYLFQEQLQGIIELEDRQNTDTHQHAEVSMIKALLSTILALHSQEFLHLDRKVARELTRCEAGHILSIDFQETIRGFMNITDSQIGKNNSYRRLLKRFHDSEELQVLLDLTTFADNPALYSDLDCVHPSEAISAMIEAFLMDHITLGTKLLHLKSRLEGTQERLRTSLTRSQNDLFVVYMVIMSVNVVVTACTYPITLFSTNLTMGIPEQFIDEDAYLFWVVSGLLLAIFSLASYLLYRFYVVQCVPYLALKYVN